jgi:hypothetical protein
MGGIGSRHVIRVLPLDELGGRSRPVVGVKDGDPLSWASHRRFTPSGRSALAAVLSSLALEPPDDVLITSSSGQTYISPCVTCIVFNHCRPSRVLTDRTRAIVVIHEYGYPHPQLGELCETARGRRIPLIEDCAHSFDSTVDGAPLGSFGDFAVFSLPKVFPVPAGGVLIGNKGALEGPADQSQTAASVEAAYREHAPALPEYSRRRRQNYDAVRSRFSDLPLLLEAGPGVTPFFIGLLRADALEIRQRSAAIEWGSTLRDDLLLVTTNPFVDAGALVGALDGAIARRELT